MFVNPYEALAARVIKLVEDDGGKVMAIPMADGYYGIIDFGHGGHESEGPFLSETSAKVEAAMAFLESVYEMQTDGFGL